MSKIKTSLTLAAIAIGYACALLMGQHATADSTNGSMALAIDGETSSCKIENHYIGDGVIRGRQTCSPSQTDVPHGHD
ncbi:hypothetical protein QZM82_31985 [Burkholderia cepacia]|uniref:hypothetical protein n=1 Tax=Burkholderia cepacia TaxID=292 RepID=UPI0026564DEB|nr:hypothetical protein [Burkholderia cepacia]MDN7900821.1 hypothetical protein [Burkholderia cepacia]